MARQFMVNTGTGRPVHWREPYGDNMRVLTEEEFAEEFPELVQYADDLCRPEPVAKAEPAPKKRGRPRKAPPADLFTDAGS